MEVISNNFMPGDQRLIQQIVYELKSQGIFDHFRKECIADVDTKPAYQNLRQRVEGNVTTFLNQQTWSSDMNKNQIREQLKKSIHDSGFLDSGVERIVEQVVNPKINTVFLPKVEDVVYRYLGIAKPEKEPVKSVNVDIIDLLPTDLEAVSPDSSHVEKNESLDENRIKIDNSGTNMDNSTTKFDEDESPPFEALENQPNILTHNENSVDSHLSGFSGIRSHENSNLGSDTKVCQMDISSMDSQTSQNSTESRLSIVTSDEMKIEISDDSQTRMEKSSDFTINNEMFNGTPMEVFPGVKVEPENIVEEYKNTESNKKECEIERPNQKDQNTKFDEKKSHDKKTDEKRIENDGKDEKRIENDRKDDRKSRSSDKHGSRNRRDDKHSKSDKDRSKIKHNSSSSQEKDLSVTSSSKEKETSSSSSTSSTKEKNREVSSSSKSKELSSPTKDKSKSKDRKDSKSSSGSKDKEKHDRDKNMDKPDKENSKTHGEREKTDKSREKHSKEKQDKIKSEKDKSNKDKSLKDKSDKSGKEKYEKYDKNKSEKQVRIKSEKIEYEKEKSDKDNSDKMKEKLDKEKSDLDRPNKEKSEKKKERYEKDKSKNSSSSSGKLSSSSKEKSSSSSSKKDKDKASSDNREKSKSSNSDSKVKRSDSKTISGEVKSENTDYKSHKNYSKLNTSDSKSKHQKDEKHSRSTSSSKHSKDKKRDKQSKDDHYSSRDKKDDRRSTDRDSNDGSSNRQSTSSSYVEKKSSTSHNCAAESNSFSGSGGTDSGNSGQADNNTVTTSSNVSEKVLNEIPAVFNESQKLKYVKPKFASNFQEAIKIMKIRKQIAKLERQNQLSLSEITLQKPVQNGFGDEKETKSDEQVEKLEQENRTITPVNCSSPKKLKITPIKTTNLSKENWEALEARLAQEMSNVNYNSYDLYDDYDYSNSEIVVSPIKNVVIPVEEPKKVQKEAEEERNITISKEVESITEKSKQENKMDKFGQESVEKIVESDNLESVEQIVESDNFDNLEQTPNAIVKDSFEKQKHLSKGEDQKPETEEEAKGVDQKQERVEEVIGCAKSKITKETADEDILLYPKADSPCRYLEKQSPSLEQRLQFLHDFVSKLEREVEMCQKSFQNNFSNTASGASKRKREDYVVMTNNNKADYEQSTEVKNRLRPPNTAISKANKDKTNQSADVIPNEGFSLPLSPESDISNDKKEEELTKPVKRRKVAGKGVAQRYSSEELYKPRPTFTGTRRTRSAKNFE